MRKIILSVFVLAALACGDDKDDPKPVEDAAVEQPEPDAGSGDGEPDAGVEPTCFEMPETHVEIINGCTDAEAIVKTPVLPLRNADGSLPPLP